jgi:hypothetical protein
MESFIDYAKKLGDDPKEVKIVRHYAMKFIKKEKWTAMVKNRRVWDKQGALYGLWTTIIAMHYHFIADGKEDVMSDPNATITRKRHVRSMRDWWEEEVEEREKEIEALREDVITKEEHKEILRDVRKEHERECEAMDYEIRKLKSQLAFAKDKMEARDKVHEQQLAFHQETQDAMEKCHQSALKAAVSS